MAAIINRRPTRFTLNPQHSLTNGLVAAYLGQGAGGDHYHDSGPLGNHGTLTGFTGAGNTPGDRWGVANGRSLLEFANANAEYINAGMSAFSPVGFSVFSRCRFIPFVGSSGIISKRTNGSGDSFQLVASNNAFNEHDLQFAVWIGGVPCIAVDYANRLNGSWNTVFGVFDNSTVSAFVDGIQTASASASGTMDSSSSPVSIGRTYSDTYIFKGQMSDSAIWSRSLTNSEIAILSSPDPLYSGWIVPDVARKHFVMSGATGPARFPWKQRRIRRMAGAR